MTEYTEDYVRKEARKWLENNWDPNLDLFEWRNKLEKDTLYYEVQVAPCKLVIFPTFLSHDVSEYTDETSLRISLDTGIEVE